jgi:hypothetical protein
MSDFRDNIVSATAFGRQIIRIFARYETGLYLAAAVLSVRLPEVPLKVSDPRFS